MSLEIIINSFSHITNSSRIRCTHIQEASFCTCKKGSLTLEATVVLPLMAGFFISILFLFRVLMVQAAVEEALVYVGRVIAVESCVFDEEGTLYISDVL